MSQPRPADVAVRAQIGADRFMWGSDYPHDEGTYPFTRETLRQVMLEIGPDEKQRILAEDAPTSMTSIWQSLHLWRPSSVPPSTNSRGH